MAYDADVIVVGAGLAGLVAAAELIDARKKIIILDQEPEQSLGGQAFWSFGGIFLVDSPEQRRLRIRDSHALALSDWMATATFDRDEDFWPRKWAEAYVAFAAGEKRSWLRDRGIRFFPVVGWAERGGDNASGHGNSVPRFHITWGTGPGVLEPFVRRTSVAEQKGVIAVKYRHRVDELLLSNGAIRNGQQSAIATDIIALMDALKIENAILAGFDWGARTVNIIAALWPERCRAMVSVSGYLIGNQEAGKVPLPPKAELQWWYQYYFATERGRAGYDKYRHDFAKLIWQLASPKWNFTDATFDRSAAAFDNPDHVGIVIHNYRWRLGLVEGEPKYDSLEKRLAEAPVITVPTITLEGDANGAPHPLPDSYAGKFSGKYAHRNIDGGVGHNLPQEAPKAFAQAIIDVDGFI